MNNQQLARTTLQGARTPQTTTSLRGLEEGVPINPGKTEVSLRPEL